MQALVSICIPIYNGEKFIDGAFESISQQTYKNIEIVVVNDGSTDQSAIKAEQALDHYGLKGQVVSIENKGCEGARDHACSLASGEFIAPIDIDDKWSPEYLDIMISILGQQNQAGLIYCDFADYDERTEYTVKKSEISPWIRKDQAINLDNDAFLFEKRQFFKMLLIGQVLFPSCTVFRRTLYERVGGYWKDLKLRVSSDWDFGLRASLEDGVIFVDKVMLTKLRHDSNLSGNQLFTAECDIKVLNNFFSRYQLTKEEESAAKKRLSARASDAGYCYLMAGSKLKAINKFIVSFSALPNLRSFKLIIVSMIPTSLVNIIRSVKH